MVEVHGMWADLSSSSLSRAGLQLGISVWAEVQSPHTSSNLQSIMMKTWIAHNFDSFGPKLAFALQLVHIWQCGAVKFPAHVELQQFEGLSCLYRHSLSCPDLPAHNCIKLCLQWIIDQMLAVLKVFTKGWLQAKACTRMQNRLQQGRSSRRPGRAWHQPPSGIQQCWHRPAGWCCTPWQQQLRPCRCWP